MVHNLKPECVVLIHGFFRTRRDMQTLARALARSGYAIETPTLPTTRLCVDGCTARLEQFLLPRLDRHHRVHMVGHSMGGLIIRRFLSRNELPWPGRCVLIATPNQGSPLITRACRLAPILTSVLQPLADFRDNAPPIPPPMNGPHPDIGAIAGAKSTWPLRRLIPEPNDGRVYVASVPFPGMTGFIKVPFSHNQMHHRPEVASLVETFLRTGAFTSNESFPTQDEVEMTPLR